jgi:hypothetical protein
MSHELNTESLSEKLKGGDYLKNFGVDGRTTVK